jgi:hypothetical protein
LCIIFRLRSCRSLAGPSAYTACMCATCNSNACTPRRAVGGGALVCAQLVHAHSSRSNT